MLLKKRNRNFNCENLKKNKYIKENNRFIQWKNNGNVYSQIIIYEKRVSPTEYKGAVLRPEAVFCTSRSLYSLIKVVQSSAQKVWMVIPVNTRFNLLLPYCYLTNFTYFIFIQFICI